MKESIPTARQKKKEILVDLMTRDDITMYQGLRESLTESGQGTLVGFYLPGNKTLDFDK